MIRKLNEEYTKADLEGNNKRVNSNPPKLKMVYSDEKRHNVSRN